MEQGKEMEVLGTVLAWAGWLGAALVGALLLRGLVEWGAPAGDAVGIVLQLGAWVVTCLAVAGIGHLLRAVAQLGRNVHRLGLLLQRPG